jgi:hypothetical protein
MSKQMNWRWVAVLLAAGAVGGCSELRLSPDYGVAVRQNVAAQIADPEPRYTGDPKPASNGQRAQAAMQGYVTGRVVQPASTGIASASGGGGATPAQ